MGCSASVGTAYASTTHPHTAQARGPTYDANLDGQVRRLFDALGPDRLENERLLWAISYEFYNRVEQDKEMPEFAEAFSTPAARASELLTWFLAEAWGGPALYSAARGSHFSFLYSTHTVWRFQLTDKYWKRWFHHYLTAASHYCELQAQHAAAGTPCPLVLPVVSQRHAQLREKMGLPPIDGGTHIAHDTAVDDPTGVASSVPLSCPFGATAAGATLPVGHPPLPLAGNGSRTETSTAPTKPSASTLPVIASAPNALSASSARPTSARIFPQHLITIEYYLKRLRSWMDVPTQEELNKHKHINVFD